MAKTCPACGRPAVSVEDIGKSFQSRGTVRCAFCDAVHLAKADWRDLLVSAGFANDINVHKQWFPDDAAS